MDLILPFVSIIGVIVGFLLSTLKEWIQNKPRIKMDMERGEFNYYFVELDELFQEIIKPTFPQDAEYYKVKIRLNIYNSGKGNTAINSIMVENVINKRCLSYSEVTIQDSSKQIISAFNLPASSILTLDLEWKVEKEEYTSSLFDLDLITIEKSGLKFKLISKSINNKEYKFVVDPLSIFTAY